MEDRKDPAANDRGASLVEYALLVALIAVACLLAVNGFGGATADTFSSAGSRLTEANSS